MFIASKTYVHSSNRRLIDEFEAIHYQLLGCNFHTCCKTQGQFSEKKSILASYETVEKIIVSVKYA